MEMEFAYDVKGAMLPTLTVNHAEVIKREIKSRMSHIDVNDESVMAAGIQPRRQ